MKLYCKIKRDGKWNWVSADSPWKQHVARGLCECRICRPDKPETISQEDESICLGGANAQELIDHVLQENPPSSSEE